MKPVSVLSIACACAAGLTMVAAQSDAGVVQPGGQLSVTNQGPAHDNSGDTAQGWTGYLLALVAPPGQMIEGISFGEPRSFGVPGNSSTLGIRGQMLQDWIPHHGSHLSTPIGSSLSDANGSYNGTDSHLLTRSPITFQLSEDNDLVHPPGAPRNLITDTWGTGHRLQGDTLFGPGDQLSVQPIAYLVLRNGSTATVAAEALPTGGGPEVGVDAEIVVPRSVPLPAAPMLALSGLCAWGIPRAFRINSKARG
ncbi:MAG TPA: hypothetical protein VLI90_04470 [Tepidisphaeraceae bacterium]|nr:hypothetical protein [Tepidisphaeraceae bacterium]